MKKIIFLLLFSLCLSVSAFGRVPELLDDDIVDITANTYNAYAGHAFSTGVDIVVISINDASSLTAADSGHKIRWSASATPDTYTANAAYSMIDPSVPDNYDIYLNENQSAALTLYFHVPGSNTTSARVNVKGWRVP